MKQKRSMMVVTKCHAVILVLKAGFLEFPVAIVISRLTAVIKIDLCTAGGSKSRRDKCATDSAGVFTISLTGLILH